ncbi:phage protein D [Methanomethylovorans hollandica DSM 15978]|uniref:Phage protein D n=1 Tax=Methanomethylovorans hollandica (strain DSM 15978 / NBRC 107637 / DMS1) TaxID=867904 RepID=L0KWK6_METHD|nr:phage late control D family protein [Methanomethylovorans hollandica]AGB49812.1 phage protein D [Methanomethylovorans hollandica DSM 15978]
MAGLLIGPEIYVPSFTVKWEENNEGIPKDDIIGVEIDEDLESPGMFKISFNEQFDLAKQQFKWLDDRRIEPGTRIMISFGYASAPQEQGTIMGKIKAISPGFLSGGPQALIVEGYDLSHDLQKRQHKVKCDNVTYADVAREIAMKNDLSPAGVESDKLIVHPKIERKVDEMDYAFLQGLAKNIGFEFFVRNKTLYFRKPKDDLTANVSFTFNQNIISFSPRMSSANLVHEVRVTAWSEQEKKTISEKANIKEIESSIGIPDFSSIVEKAEGEKSSLKLEGRVVRSREEAKAIALSELKKRNMGFITGTLECAGNPQLRSGMTINIEKVGKCFFSGVYYVTKTRHVLGESGYKTTLEVRRCL